MEKKYYIAENGNPVGPFTPEELRERGITADTRIYAKGWTDFRDASEIPELAACLSLSKPAASAPSSSASREVGNVSIGGASPASAPTSAADSSEKELLMRILSHLDELQRENRQLKAEMESMRNGEPKQTPPPPLQQTPQKTVATPPPFNPSATTSTAVQTTEEWDKEWERTANTTVRADKKKSGGHGCLIALIVAAIIAIIGCVIYVLSRDNHSYATADSDSAAGWTYDEYAVPAEQEAAPAEEAEVAAPAEDYGWDVAQ